MVVRWMCGTGPVKRIVALWQQEDTLVAALVRMSGVGACKKNVAFSTARGAQKHIARTKQERE